MFFKGYYIKFNADGTRDGSTIVKHVHYTTDEELQKYIDGGFIAVSDDDQDLYYASNEYIRDTKTGKPIPKPPYVPTVQEVAAQTWMDIKAARDIAEVAGCPYMGKVLDNDSVSIQRINTQAQAAQLALTLKQPFGVAWTMQNNSIVIMTAQDILGMPLAIANYSNRLHGISRKLRESIDIIVAEYEQKTITEARAKTALSKIKFTT